MEPEQEKYGWTTWNALVLRGVSVNVDTAAGAYTLPPKLTVMTFQYHAISTL